MQIELEGEAEAILHRLLESGEFATPQEAVANALRRAEHEQKLAWMRARVQEALDEGGEVTLEELDRDMEELLQRLEKELP